MKNISVQKRIFSALTTALIGGLFASAVQASPVVPAATFEVWAGTSNPIYTPGTVTWTGCGADGGCASSSATATAALTFSASGNSTGAEAIAYATGDFFYTVTGPSNVYVPLILSASTSTSASGANTSVYTDINIRNDSTYAGYSFRTCAGYLCMAPSSRSINYAYSLTTNTLGDVSMYASGSSPLGSFTATIDPTISIDPGWLALNPGYKVVLSSNITPVPEPDTYAMMLAGLGLLGFIATRRS